MSTLDTTLLIQSPVAPASTTSPQSKPTQGFQQFLEDATHKVSNPAPKAKTNAASPHSIILFFILVSLGCP